MKHLHSLLLAMAFAVGSNAQSTYLGEAEKFGVLSEMSVLSNTATEVKGWVGAKGNIDNKIISTDPIMKYADSPCLILKALADFVKARQDLHNLIAVPIPKNINGGTFPPGVREVTQPAQMSGHIILQGGSQDEFVFNFKQNLAIKPNTKIELLGGVKPENVYFNVETQLSIGTNSEIRGNFLAGGSINAINLLYAEESRLHGGGNVNLGGIPKTGLIAISNVFPAPQAKIIASGPTTFCAGGSVTLTANNGAKSYQWNTGATSQSITVTQSGTYTVNVTFQNNCTASTSQQVTVNPLPVADAGSDTAIFSGQSVQIGSSPISGNTYSWSPSAGLNDANIANPIANPSVNTTYYLLVTNSFGCIAIDSTKISIKGNALDSDGIDSSLQDTIGNIFDRFGNRYTREDITRHTQGGGGAPLPPPQGPSPCIAGIFQLDFVGNQFSSNSDAQNVATVACQVFTDLTALLYNSQCNGQPPTVYIEVLSEGLPPGALASATSYYTTNGINDNNGIIDGDIWKAINTGTNESGIYDGQVTVGFGYTWNFGINTIPSSTEFDLYSVLLHEAIHALGFASLISSTGAPKAGANFGHYSRYDMYLQTSGGVKFITSPDCYEYSFTASLAAITDGGCGVEFNGPNAGIQPVYAPAGYSGGSSLSHFDNDCPSLSSHNFVMNPFIAPGNYHKTPTPEEVRTLCDIGYSTTGIFGDGNFPTLDDGITAFHVSNLPACGTTIVAGLDDGFDNQSTCNDEILLLQTCSLAVLTVNPIINDIGAASFDCLEILSDGGAISNTSGTTFDFNPLGETGIFNLRYIPVGIDGVTTGNITYIRIIVAPCGTCATPANCNQVCNYDFSDHQCIPPENCGTVPFNNGWVDNWMPSHGSPQVAQTADDYAAMWALGMDGSGNNIHSGEGTLTWVDVQPNKNYIFSYFRRSRDTDSQNPLDNIFVYLLPLGVSGIPTPSFTIPAVPTSRFKILQETNVPYSEDFEQVVVCFQTPDDGISYQWLWIYPDQYSGSGQSWLNIDKIELIEDNFSAGEDQTILCGNVELGADANLCSVLNITYEWREIGKPGILGSNSPIIINNLSSGTHTFQLTRIFPNNPNTVIYTAPPACISEDEIVVNVQNDLVVTIDIDNQPNCGQNNGEVTANPTGGITPYIYEWENILDNNIPVQNTQTATGLSAGTYAVTVTDGNGCKVTETVSLSDIDGPVLNFSSTSVTCEGANNGTATVTASGGTSPYTYLWDSNTQFQTSQTATGLSGGVYYISVSSTDGCTASGSITVSEPFVINLTLITTPASCPIGSNGIIDISVSGGTSPYTYIWSTPDQFIETATGLIAGTYTVTVTDINGCSKVGSGSINSTGDLSLIISGTSPLCNGGFDGSVTIDIPAGTSPYIYQWSDPQNTLLPGIPPGFQNTATATGLPAGTYSVTVTDANLCVGSISINLTDPLTLIQHVEDVTNISCFGESDGEINLTVNGGTPPYLFTWEGYDNVGPNGFIALTEDISGLSAGKYVVTITDDVGDCKVVIIEITQPSLINIANNVTNICGIEPGAVNINVIGGTTPYTFLWSPGGEVAEDISGITTAGTYTVTVTDANNCTLENSSDIIFSPEITLTTTATDVFCFGGNNGSIDLSVSGGLTPFTYNWSNNATTQDISGLTVGTYQSVVTDFAGCVKTINVIIAQPDELLLSSTISDVSCFGETNGSIDLTVSGGASPYTFNWSNSATSEDISNLAPGAYNVTTTDNNNCSAVASFNINQPNSSLNLSYVKTDISCYGANDGSIDLSVNGGTSPYSFLWTTGANTEDIFNLLASTYLVSVTDANGCTATQSVVINEPGVITLLINSMDVSCNGAGDGSASVSQIYGGFSPFTFIWNDLLSQTTQAIANLEGGTFTVTVTDATGCNVTASTIVSEPNTNLTITAAVTNVSCFGMQDGAIDITVSGGVSPYSFTWIPSPPLLQNVEDQTGLSGNLGNPYSVIITDASGNSDGCIALKNIGVIEPQPLTISISTTDATCSMGSDGTATANISGGTSPYSYEWSTIPSQFSLTATGLSASSSYNVIITDASGCTVSESVGIKSTYKIIFSFEDNCADFGNNNGSIDITMFNSFSSAPPYSFTWSNGSTNEDLSGLYQGVYSVTITDNVGCSVSIPVSVHNCCFGDNLLHLVGISDGPVPPCDDGDGVTEETDFIYSPCPGQDFNLTLFIQNNSNEDFQVGTQIEVQLEYMQFLSFISSTCAITGNYSNTSLPVFTLTSPLSPNTTCAIQFSVTNITIPPDGIWNILATVTSTCDGNQVIDEYERDFGNACSCDPNYKSVFPSGCGTLGLIPKDETLFYEIYFQNLGTGPAHNVVLRDTIDYDLDLSSFRLVSASHNVTAFNIFNSTREVVVSFDSIELPSFETDFLGSIGYIRYSVSQQNNLPDGTEILNKTGIFFDGNSPVITNEVSNTVVTQPQPTVAISSQNTTLFYGYSGENCTDLTASASGAQAPYSYLWNTSENTESIMVCPENSSTYSVIANALGCLSEPDSIFITVADIRCGQDSDKVLICHIPSGNPLNTQEICVNASDVSYHLAHGDYLGHCFSASAKTANPAQFSSDNLLNEINKPEGLIFEIIPNPVNNQAILNLAIPESEKVSVFLFSVTGEKVAEILMREIPGGILFNKQLNFNSVLPGVYYCIANYQNQSLIKKVVVIR